MKLNPDDIRRLAKFTLENGPDEVTCEEWLHLVGEYVERKHAGEPEDERTQRVARHVQKCTHCAEELELLEGLLGDDASS